MSLITTYLKLTKEYSDKYGDKTVILMMVGSFYEIYGEKTTNGDGSFLITGSKIEEISKLCDLTIAQKTGQHVMAGFTYTKIDKYLKKLQDAGYTAVVITQDPNNPSNRNVEGIYSPGTFFNTDSAEISNNSMCIWIEQVSHMKNKSIVVGLANVDIYTGRVTIFEYTTEDKHNPTTYDELERYISTYKPSEIIMITNFSEKILDDIINYTGILCKNIHKVILTTVTTPLSPSLHSSNYLVENARKCEKQTYQKEILNKFYKFNIISSFIDYTTRHEYATQAFIFLLQFLYEHNPNLVNKIREPIFDNRSDRVILANHSLKQLNIIDDDSYNGKYSSVSKFLNNCITPMGSRKFKNKILNPIFDCDKLNKEYDITEYIINKRGDSLIMEWRTNMGELKDIEKLHRQIIHNKVTPRSVFHLYNNMTTISSMYDKMRSDTKVMAYILSELENKKGSYGLQGTPIPDISELCKKLQSFIETHLVLEKCFTIDNLNFEENFIRPLVSETLDSIVYDYENSYIELQTIQSYLCDVVSSCEKASKTEKKYEYVKIHDTEKMGYSLVTTKRRAKLLEEQMKKQLKTAAKTEIEIKYETYKKEPNTLRLELSGLSYPVASGSNTSIQSTQIDKICSTIIKSKQKMRTAIENIFTEFIKNIQNNFESDIQIIVDMVTMIDVLQNQVYVALKNNYCKPVIIKKENKKENKKANTNANTNATDDSFVKARDLRHCLIEHINTNELYVTNDIELGNNTEQNGILLYGTNAVGKTSLIRALGIAVIMAQAGLYVPCSSFEYIPYKSIFTRILGNDNLFKGLSTFMVEMSELRVILKSANNYGLILGDELCSGTEMDSAISIFVAGLKKLHDAKCSFIFATHMHEINKYDEIEEMDRLSMKHLEVTYNKENDVLVYDRKLKDGPGFSMYGLEVCRSLHLPEDFLKYANEIRLKYRNNEQSILSAKPSKYNAKKIRNICEMCNSEMGTEIHHLQHQKNADQRNFIGHFHKNHVANLVSICEKCHDMVHSNDEQHRKVMTSSGPIIIKM